MPDAFLSDLATLGLPACAGAALGLDRLLAAALGAATLDDVTLHLGAP
jgi:elongation factor P--beta-lysine ligase